MDRERAIAIARECAKAKPQSYYSEPFQPHEWVIDAILLAAVRPQNDAERLREIALEVAALAEHGMWVGPRAIAVKAIEFKEAQRQTDTGKEQK